MYIVCFYDNRLCEVICQSVSLKWLVNTLEEKQLRYTVSSSEGKLKQEDFGFGGCNYWVQDLFENKD